MAVNSETFDRLVREGYGPLRFVARDDGVDTRWNGHDVTLRPRAGTVCVSSTRPRTWPAWGGPDAADADWRIRRALTEVVIDRSELVRVDPHPAGSSLSVSLWIDAERSTPADLASAVCRIDAIGDVVAWALELGETASTDAGVAEPAGPAAQPEPEPDATVTRETATSAAAASPAVGSTADEPPWCYVVDPVDVLDPADTERTIARLEPGTWYLLLHEQDGWMRVTDAGHTFEGWAPAGHVYRRTE